jgi:hypothetical protein
MAAASPLRRPQATGLPVIVEQPQGLPAPAVVVLPACPGGDSGPPQPGTAPPVPAELEVHPQSDGGRRLEPRGELDLGSAATLRGLLLAQLSSAGVRLLIEAVGYADAHCIPLQLQLIPHSFVARIVGLTDLDTSLPVTQTRSGPLSATVQAEHDTLSTRTRHTEHENTTHRGRGGQTRGRRW